MEGILFIIVAVALFCSYLLSKRMFAIYKEKEGQWALFFSIGVFILSFASILAAAYIAVLLFMPWGR